MGNDTKIRGGFTRTFIGRDGRKAAVQAKRLEAYGVKKIIAATEYPLDKALTAFCRAPGDVLAVDGGLRVLADTRLEMVEEYRKLHAKGFVLLDIETGERSDRDGVLMLQRAISRANYDSRVQSHEKQVEAGHKGAAATAQTRSRGRMRVGKAREIWQRDDLNIPDKLKLMTKWTRETAFAKLGPTGVPPGRKPRND